MPKKFSPDPSAHRSRFQAEPENGPKAPKFVPHAEVREFNRQLLLAASLRRNEGAGTFSVRIDTNIDGSTKSSRWTDSEMQKQSIRPLSASLQKDPKSTATPKHPTPPKSNAHKNAKMTRLTSRGIPSSAPSNQQSHTKYQSMGKKSTDNHHIRVGVRPAIPVRPRPTRKHFFPIESQQCTPEERAEVQAILRDPKWQPVLARLRRMPGAGLVLQLGSLVKAGRSESERLAEAIKSEEQFLVNLIVAVDKRNGSSASAKGKDDMLAKIREEETGRVERMTDLIDGRQGILDQLVTLKRVLRQVKEREQNI